VSLLRESRSAGVECYALQTRPVTGAGPDAAALGHAVARLLAEGGAQGVLTVDPTAPGGAA
jgi:hypothetical protein